MTAKARTKGPVYCAGPMFSDAEKLEQARLARVLETHGYGVYLPQRDGLEVATMMGHLNRPELREMGMLDMLVVARFTTWIMRAVYALDVYQVARRCQCIVLNVDGRVPDEGSIAETAIGFSVGVPVVMYKTSGIAMLSGNDNPMVTGLSGWLVPVTGVRHLVKGVEHAMADPRYKPRVRELPPVVQGIAKLGQDVWEIHEGKRTGLSRPSLDLIEQQTILQSQASATVASVIALGKLSRRGPARDKAALRLLTLMTQWAKDPAVRSAL